MTEGSGVVIVGGGLSGLTTAYRLLGAAEGRGGRSVVVCEAAERVGGKLRTDRVNGFVVEAGADGFVAVTGEAVALAEDLGIGDEISPVNPTPVRAYLRSGDRLVPFLGKGSSPVSRPRSLLSSPILSLAARARVLLEPLVPRRSSDEDESVAEFLTRRLGGRAYRDVFEPLLSGIHGSSPTALSAQATLPRLVAMEAQGRSLLGRPGGSDPERARVPELLTLRSGMARLAESLREAVGPARVRTGTRVTEVVRGKRAWEVRMQSGSVERAGAVVLAVPAHAAAELLGGMPGLGETLRRFVVSHTAVVNLAYPESAVSRPLDAHGYLIPRRGGGPISACTWSSSKFDGRAPEGQVLLRAFLREEAVAPSGVEGDAEMTRFARQELAEGLGIDIAPLWARVNRWSGAVYDMGHRTRAAEVRALVRELPGLALVGASYDGVSVEAVIGSATRGAERIEAMLRPRAYA